MTTCQPSSPLLTNPGKANICPSGPGQIEIVTLKQSTFKQLQEHFCKADFARAISTLNSILTWCRTCIPLNEIFWEVSLMQSYWINCLSARFYFQGKRNQNILCQDFKRLWLDVCCAPWLTEHCQLDGQVATPCVNFSFPSPFCLSVSHSFSLPPLMWLMKRSSTHVLI